MVKCLFLTFLFIFTIIKSSGLNIEANNFEDFNKNYIAIDTNNKLSFMKKNLIISTITNYDWDKVGIFFKSYKMAKFQNCDCIVFVSKISEKTIQKIESCGATVNQISDKYENESVINSRWKIIEDYLNDNQEKYNLVLATDIKGVLFQKDVFNIYNNLTKPFFGVAIEDGTLNEEFKFNKKWIIDTYGEDKYNTISNERIISLGTIWGTPDKVTEFSKIMLEKLSSERSKEFNAVDQSLCNYLIYHDKLFSDCLVKSNNNDGFVMALGTTKRKDIFLDKNNNILNGNGLIGAAILQNDIHPDLLDMAILKYCPELLIQKISISTIIISILIFICSIIGFVFYYKCQKKRMEINEEKFEMAQVTKEENNSQSIEETDESILNSN